MFFYFRHSLNQMLRTFFALVCADRYASCHNRASIRVFSQYKAAIRVIPSVIIFCFLVLVFSTEIRTLSNGVCDARSGVYDIIELIICFITISPITITHVYKTATLSVVKSKDRQQIELFFYFFFSSILTLYG